MELAGRFRDLSGIEQVDKGPSPYHELDTNRQEIRILLLRPGKGRDDIHCDLQKVSLLDVPRPKYETISYAWGNPKKKGIIYLHGRPVKVGASAKRALQRFRLEHECRSLWIDAICIDQTNFGERSQQVAIMAEIYSTGSHGLVWLGDDDGYAANAKLAIDAIIADARKETDDFRLLEETMFDTDGKYLFSSDGLSVSIEAKPLTRFFSAPWFGRLWVVQEAALAGSSTCYWGNVDRPLFEVLIAATWLDFKRMYLPFNINEYPSIDNAASIWKYADQKHGLYRDSSQWGPDLVNLLFDLRRFDTFEPRDHVFGILGLYRRSLDHRQLPATLMPDYTKPLHKVLRDATRVAIIERRGLDIFSHLHRRRHGSVGDVSILPTWVPRWDQRWDLERDAANLESHLFAHNGKELVLLDHADADENILTVSGVSIDQVAAVTETIDKASLQSDKSTLAVLQRMETILHGLDVQVENRERIEAAMAITICGGEDHLRNPITESDARLAMQAYRDFLVLRGGLPPTLREEKPGLTAETPEVNMASHFDQTICQTCINRRFFVTQKGRPGVGSQLTEKGDIIAVLYGCRLPVILRPRQASGHCDILDVAYVYGIMEGEAVQEHERQGTEDQVFHIH